VVIRSDIQSEGSLSDRLKAEFLRCIDRTSAIRSGAVGELATTTKLCHDLSQIL
jgi:hypothetical protein